MTGVLRVVGVMAALAFLLLAVPLEQSIARTVDLSTVAP
jgi:hypothetical protein